MKKVLAISVIMAMILGIMSVTSAFAYSGDYKHDDNSKLDEYCRRNKNYRRNIFYNCIDLELYVRCDDTEFWAEPSDRPGSPGTVESDWWYKFTITNIGVFELSNITLTEDVYGDISLPVDSLLPGESVELILGPYKATKGNHKITATVTGYFWYIPFTDTESVSYVANPAPKRVPEPGKPEPVPGPEPESPPVMLPLE